MTIYPLQQPIDLQQILRKNFGLVPNIPLSVQDQIVPTILVQLPGQEFEFKAAPNTIIQVEAAAGAKIPVDVDNREIYHWAGNTQNENDVEFNTSDSYKTTKNLALNQGEFYRLRANGWMDGTNISGNRPPATNNPSVAAGYIEIWIVDSSNVTLWQLGSMNFHVESQPSSGGNLYTARMDPFDMIFEWTENDITGHGLVFYPVVRPAPTNTNWTKSTWGQFSASINSIAE